MSLSAICLLFTRNAINVHEVPKSPHKRHACAQNAHTDAFVIIQGIIHVFHPKRNTNHLSHTNIFEPVRPAVLLHQPRFSVCKSSLHTSFTFRRIWTIEIGDMLISDIAEPSERLAVQTEEKISEPTNEFCSSLQIVLELYCVQVHLPISHRRTRLLGLDG